MEKQGVSCTTQWRCLAPRRKGLLCYKPVSWISICSTHNKPHGVHGLGKHYYMCFYPKLGHITCVICSIPCAWTQFTYILDQPWTPSVPPHQKPRYQPVKYFTYWPFRVYFDKWNIIQFSHKATYIENIEKNHQFVLNCISNNMAALVQTGQYGAINISNKTTMG